MVSRHLGAATALTAAAAVLCGCGVTAAPIDPAPAAATASNAPVPAASTTADRQPVTRVIDGDTFDTPEGRVRVAVIDSCEHDTPGGARATAEAHQLLDGQTVTLTPVTRDRDDYGRLLRIITLSDGRDYGNVMVAADHTAVYAGHQDATPQQVAAARALDANGRTCGPSTGGSDQRYQQRHHTPPPGQNGPSTPPPAARPQPHHRTSAPDPAQHTGPDPWVQGQIDWCRQGHDGVPADQC